MTRYTVVWSEDVEEPFIDYWVKGNSQTRAILTEIANWVDTTLSEDPAEKGIYAPDFDTRVLAVDLSSTSAHVSITYEIYPDDRLVRVVLLTIRS